MKRLILSLTVLFPLVMVCSAVMAQDPGKMKVPPKPNQAFGEPEQTQDMWFYLQELRRYDDPQVVIRRKAERKAEQRRQRLAAMKWYGWSQGRPTANPIPYMGVYSPSWVGNGVDPYHWIGNAYVTTAVRIETTTKSR